MEHVAPRGKEQYCKRTQVQIALYESLTLPFKRFLTGTFAGEIKAYSHLELVHI